jgi:hypothetical protein
MAKKIFVAEMTPWINDLSGLLSLHFLKNSEHHG